MSTFVSPSEYEITTSFYFIIAGVDADKLANIYLKKIQLQKNLLQRKGG